MLNKMIGEFSPEEILALLRRENIPLDDKTIVSGVNGIFVEITKGLTMFIFCGASKGSNGITFWLGCDKKVTLRGLRKLFPKHTLRNLGGITTSSIAARVYKLDTIGCLLDSIKAMLHLHAIANLKQ